MYMFLPPENTLKKYADVLVKFALGSGNGIGAGDVVLLNLSESAKPLLRHLLVSVYEAGGHPLVEYQPEGLSRIRFECAREDQLIYYPHNYLLSHVETISHMVGIISTDDKYE